MTPFKPRPAPLTILCLVLLWGCGDRNPFSSAKGGPGSEALTEQAEPTVDEADAGHEDAIGVAVENLEEFAGVSDQTSDEDPTAEAGSEFGGDPEEQIDNSVQTASMPLLACEYRTVANTKGSRLLVSDSPGSTFKVMARLHPDDQVRVLSQRAGRSVSDPALGKASSQWLQVSYPYGAGQQTGWINEMYASCLSQCTYLEVQNVGSQALLVKDTPYPMGRIVHRLYSNYVVKSLGSVADGILISDASLKSSSKVWYKIEYYDGSSGVEKQGWISSLYTFCTHGRMNSTNGTLKLPVASRLLTSTEADHKRRGSVNAWDINAAFGSPVRPISAGKVSYVGCNNAGGYGCWTYIAHDNGLFSIMAHMINGSLRVKAGDRVTQDTIVGRVGWTGFTTFGPHVHLEIISGGVKVLPGNYFDLNSMAYCLFCSLKK